jgi:glycosyltransferase involved in cell wall biosynthesis
MQCGIPVVVSNTSSIPEVVGDAGIYTEPMDKIAIKDAMEILLTDRIYSKELSQKSIAQAANFSWRNSAAKYVKIFQELMAE